MSSLGTLSSIVHTNCICNLDQSNLPFTLSMKCKDIFCSSLKRKHGKDLLCNIRQIKRSVNELQLISVYFAIIQNIFTAINQNILLGQCYFDIIDQMQEMVSRGFESKEMKVELLVVALVQAYIRKTNNSIQWCPYFCIILL